MKDYEMIHKFTPLEIYSYLEDTYVIDIYVPS